jgi:hypothetical protein
MSLGLINMQLRHIVIVSIFIFSQNLFGNDIQSLLPKKSVFTADVMIAKSTDKIEEISTRMTASLQSQKDWYMQYIENHPGVALPYHKNFGISEAEYGYFLENAKTTSTLSKVGEVELTVEALPSGKGITLKTKPENFPLNGVSIYTEEGYADTKYAKLDKESEIDQGDKASMTGRWKGKQWKYAEWDGKKGKSVTLAIGKRKDHQDGILYFDVKDLLTNPPEVYYFILLYPL